MLLPGDGHEVRRLNDDFYTPQEAWDELTAVRREYVRKHWATYSGLHRELQATAYPGSFWKRRGKAKVHVPLAADIASLSANLLFGNAPRCRIYDESEAVEKPKRTERGKPARKKKSEKQLRLDAILRESLFESTIQEAAEIATVCGDVYLKCNWDQLRLDYPSIQYVSGERAVPEYRFGHLVCVHFFTTVKTDRKSGKVWRLYELYTDGSIQSAVYIGDDGNLGTEDPATLASYGIEPVTTVPGGGMMAVHIPNIKPTRERKTDYGRSEFEGMRDLLDELDETFSSWFRDIRLAKSRLIVPVEYLRKRNRPVNNGKNVDSMFTDGSFTWEFDEDVETLVALDIANDKDMKITPSQFQIRADEHQKTAETLIRNIISMCGYSPQSFGLDIEGQAASGTALLIREKKSFSTRSKKLNYWSLPLERFLTSVLRLDADLYHQGGVTVNDRVIVEFPDSMSTDISTMANAVKMLHDAQAISTQIKVKMMHPDWEEGEVMEETERIMEEYGTGDPSAMIDAGDLHKTPTDQEDEDEDGDA